MTHEQRQAARERCEAIALDDAEWGEDSYGPYLLLYGQYVSFKGLSRGDVALYEHAHVDLPAALDEVEEKEAEVARHRESESAKQTYIKENIHADIREALKRLSLGEIPNQATITIPANRANFAEAIGEHIPALVGENVRIAGQLNEALAAVARLEPYEDRCAEQEARLGEWAMDAKVYKTERDEARAALAQVPEWIDGHKRDCDGYPRLRRYCGCCENRKGDGHAPDCKRQVGLGKTD